MLGQHEKRGLVSEPSWPIAIIYDSVRYLESLSTISVVWNKSQKILWEASCYWVALVVRFLPSFNGFIRTLAVGFQLIAFVVTSRTTNWGRPLTSTRRMSLKKVCRKWVIRACYSCQDLWDVSTCLCRYNESVGILARCKYVKLITTPLLGGGYLFLL